VNVENDRHPQITLAVFSFLPLPSEVEILLPRVFAVFQHLLLLGRAIFLNVENLFF
jgi:hypothetical protein